MHSRLYREYQLKFYLNMRHYIIINDKKGEIHPHTWEFTLHIRFGRSAFVEFSTFEKGINHYLMRYQNKIINEIEPFDTIIPTIENVADYFCEEFDKLIDEIGGTLTSISASETPTRSYVINLLEEERRSPMSQRSDEAVLSEIMDSVLDHMEE